MGSPESLRMNDGVDIRFCSRGPPEADVCIVFIHGFSGSSQYFVKNVDELATQHRVVTFDMRGHGLSGHSTHGYHVSRLSTDLRCLVYHLKQQNPNQVYVGVGCSIGSAILWLYAELFGDEDWYKFVFVDQGPLQNRELDWDLYNYGCYDEASLRNNQEAIRSDLEGFARSLVQGCLGYRYQPDGPHRPRDTAEASEDENFFVAITMQCNPSWIAKLMGDHTQYDHRDTIRERITIPTLICAGKTSGCFSLAGMLHTADLINKTHTGLAQVVCFESGHWLFYEEPEKFNKSLLEFIAS